MRRGFVLLAVMIGLAMALVAAMALLQLAQVETTGAFHSIERAQSQALARSGMAVIASELSAQRSDMLEGRMPWLEEQYVLYEAGNRFGVVRLLPVGASGERIESETGKLDINEVTATRLVATGLVDEALAERIVQFRDTALGRPIQSLNELIQVPGVTNELLFGSAERFEQQLSGVGASDDASVDRRRVSPLEARHMAGRSEPALADVLTVYSIEADVRMDGSPRFDLSAQPAEPSNEGGDDGEERSAEDESTGGAAELTDDELAELPRLLRPLVRGGATFANPSEVASVLRQNNAAAEEWPEYFEVCTTHAGELRHGRIDINRAPLAALLGVPGLSVEHAEAIASAQDSLSDAERSTVCWPLIAGIVEPEPFSEALDFITNRSWCFRVRMAAGEVSSDEPDAPLESPMIFEIVFDLASPSPRVAYLREITLLPTMLAMAGRHGDADDSLDHRMESQELDDALSAWDEAYSEEDAPVEDNDTTATAGPAALPSQPSLPDAPTLPTSAEGDAPDETPTNPPTSSNGSTPHETGSDDATSTVRRLGRWRAG